MDPRSLSQKKKLCKKTFDDLDWNRDMTIVKQNGTFYICVAYCLDSSTKKRVQADSKNRIISIDPGIRTLLTGFSPSDEKVFQIGGAGHIFDTRLRKAHKKMTSMYRKMDEIRNMHKKTGGSPRIAHLQKGIRTCKKRVSNMVDDLHWKVGKWMVTHFEHVVLPKYSNKNAHQLKTMSAYMLWKSKILNFYKFRARVLMQHQKYTQIDDSEEGGVNVKIWKCSESYTTQTCSKCGTRNRKVGASEIYRCVEIEKCGITGGRDALASRNVLLKVVTNRRIQK